MITEVTMRSIYYIKPYSLSEKKAPINRGCLGGAKRDRTADLYNAIVALSQLSYGPKFALLINFYGVFIIIII
jgi:hypothetical protein